MSQPIPSGGNMAIALAQQKSVGVAVLLTFFFGPLGMLYSTIPGAIIMFVVASVVGVFTVGIGLVVIWPIQMIWAAMAAQKHNRKVMSMAG